jgi:serine O-acetyltransferase
MDRLQESEYMKKLRSDIERFYQLAGNESPISISRCIITCFHPRIVPVVIIRLAEFFYRYRIVPLYKICAMLNVVLFGLEVSPRVKIGGGLFLPHTVGTVIGAEQIGECVTIMQGVTLGTKETDMQFKGSTRPAVGNYVTIGAGAKILGRVIIGDYAKIGANAVVLHDVPAYALAVGIPAKIVEQKTQTGNPFREDSSAV